MKKAPKKKDKGKKISGLLFWTPRVLSILFILFISLFALDIFEGEYGFWGTIIGLFMHLIPSFILIVLLAIAWRWEWVGGIAFIGFGLWYIMMLTRNSLPWYLAISWSLQIAGPAFLVGILFLMNWILKKKR